MATMCSSLPLSLHLSPSLRGKSHVFSLLWAVYANNQIANCLEKLWEVISILGSVLNAAEASMSGGAVQLELRGRRSIISLN